MSLGITTVYDNGTIRMSWDAWDACLNMLNEYKVPREEYLAEFIKKYENGEVCEVMAKPHIDTIACADVFTGYSLRFEIFSTIDPDYIKIIRGDGNPMLAYNVTETLVGDFRNSFMRKGRRELADSLRMRVRSSISRARARDLERVAKSGFFCGRMNNLYMSKHDWQVYFESKDYPGFYNFNDWLESQVCAGNMYPCNELGTRDVLPILEGFELHGMAYEIYSVVDNEVSILYDTYEECAEKLDEFKKFFKTVELDGYAESLRMCVTSKHR